MEVQREHGTRTGIVSEVAVFLVLPRPGWFLVQTVCSTLQLPSEPVLSNCGSVGQREILLQHAPTTPRIHMDDSH